MEEIKSKVIQIISEQLGKDEYMRMMHSRSSHIINKAIEDGRISI